MDNGNQRPPDGHPSATELGAMKIWLREVAGFTAQQAAQLNVGQTRRQIGATIASWNRAQAQGKSK